jgi:sodium-independent sulfate anion transporter 11
MLTTPQPVAVMSQLTGGIVADLAETLPDIDRHVIASALAILAGAIVLFIGLVRCGWIVDVISLTALSAFMTGSALNIVVGQIPAMMGISGFSTRDAPYLVFIHTLQGLPRTTLDAAMGLSALAMLYLIRGGCSYAAKRWPKHQRLVFFLSTLRTVFVILLYTMISWLVNRGLPKEHVKFKILLDVPRGELCALTRLWLSLTMMQASRTRRSPCLTSASPATSPATSPLPSSSS